MPTEAAISPKAARRIARESACQSSFDNAARAINEDWGTTFDGKQIQRWGEKLGDRLVKERDAELAAFERGERPAGPKNDPDLLVIGMDGGRVQSVQKNPETGSRWKEDKVLTITSGLRGDGKEKPFSPLVTSYMATMQDAAAFGKLARVQAERRGIRQAVEAVVIGDGGNWIDPLCEKHFPCLTRIIDYFHAAEHLHEAAQALYPQDDRCCRRLADRLKQQLYDGKINRVIITLQRSVQRLGEPRPTDAPAHPRRVLANNLAYFQRHAAHMNYPHYRKKGWPIGSGITEAGVKLMNKRVKGTEQFWRQDGAESILTLRCAWLSQDQSWQHYQWGSTPARLAA